MCGQTNAYKKELVEDFLNKCNPYENNESLRFDLRAYAAYIKENNIDVTHITDGVFSMFKK